MNEHVRGSDPGLRRAAEGVLSVIADRDELAVVLIEPDLDQWARLAACEAVAGSRTEATLRGLARDAKEDAAIRAAAQDMLSALRERGKLLRPSERNLDEEAMTLLRPTWDPPSGDVAKLVRPAEEPTDGEAGGGERRPRGLLSRLRTRKP
jgi:hypothetical protein